MCAPGRASPPRHLFLASRPFHDERRHRGPGHFGGRSRASVYMMAARPLPMQGGGGSALSLSHFARAWYTHMHCGAGVAGTAEVTGPGTTPGKQTNEPAPAGFGPAPDP